MDRVSQLLEKFRSRFGTSATAFRAPGRVNLIGEHTDYNEGFVLPAAIGFSCYVAIAPRRDRKLVVYSEVFNQAVEADLDTLGARGRGEWQDYPLGVAAVLQQSGRALQGANIYISGTVPLGAGLSSSAAIEVSTGYALLVVSGHAIDRKELALLCQRAENEYVGARSGIMDQFVSCFGRAGHALMLDCRSLEFRALPLPHDIRLVICNTMVRHALGAGEYNTRRAECEEAVRRLSAALHHIRSLRDVTLSELEQHRSKLIETLYRRARHVITENRRVGDAASALERGNIASLQGLMAESHRSLREDYEVSSRELDLMVEIASRQQGVYGARMTGGGFGGCTINLVSATESAEFQQRVAADYAAATGIKPDMYVCEASQGAEQIALGMGGMNEHSPSDRQMQGTV
jgi:galactokinase